MDSDCDYLYCGCPVADCENKVNNTYWYHHNCGGKTKLKFSNIKIIC